ncbi:MAG: hypothetical protein M1824_003449 [Vezdaea acicularis]|nr:MAG: hypothetical protein M1824_003449 [Vezdaea acicularis]
MSAGNGAIAHAAVADNKEWSKVLAEMPKEVPTSSVLSKTLVLKPKTPKSQTAILIVVVALESTQTPANLCAKAIGAKEARAAAADAIETALGVKPQDVSPLSITSVNASNIQVVLDQNLINEKNPIAIHPSDSAKTIFMTAADIESHLEKTGVKVVQHDFKVDAAAAPVTAPQATKTAIKGPKKDAKIEGAALIGIDVDKDIDFPGWYQQVLTKGEMIDYYDVSGCYVYLPASYSIWEKIQDYLNSNIKMIGVKNCYFPMFVSNKALQLEKDHIEGFAPEVAWVTKAGNTDLDEPIAIRPTSETIIYPHFSKKIRSHRDLPYRLNQWCSVVRWEFKHPMPFLRTREFLWQEGHTAFLTKAETDKEVLQVLEYYAGVYEQLLAVPVIRGRKTEKEKFPGGLYTTTVEGYIPHTGRGIQGATSHCLGQHFSKMFDIKVEDPSTKSGEVKKPPINVWQNSWGLSTRVIGVMIMIHGDKQGLVHPPRVAEYQVVVIPVGINAKTADTDRELLYAHIVKIEQTLLSAGVRVVIDLTDNYTPAWKFNNWELKGVPLRLEFGPGEAKGGFVTTARRDTGEKTKIQIVDLEEDVPKLLETIQKDMYTKADNVFKSHVIQITNWKDFVPALNAKNVCLIEHCLTEDCEDKVKELSARRQEGEDDNPQDERAPSMGAKSLCIPFEQPAKIAEGKKCMVPGCQKGAESWCLFGSVQPVSPKAKIQDTDPVIGSY